MLGRFDWQWTDTPILTLAGPRGEEIGASPTGRISGRADMGAARTRTPATHGFQLMFSGTPQHDCSQLFILRNPGRDKFLGSNTF